MANNPYDKFTENPYDIFVKGNIPEDNISESYLKRTVRGVGNSLQNVARGAVGSLQNEYYGLKGLGTDLSPEEKATISENEQFISDNPYSAGVGSLGVQLASFLLPGGAIAKAGTKALTSAPKLAALLAKMPKSAQALKVASQAGADAALGYAYNPEDEDRGTSAALSGAGSLAGRAVVGGGRIVGKAIANRFPENIIGSKILDAAKSATTTGKNVEDVATTLEKTKSPVEGISYTAAQSTQSPYFAALEKQSRTQFPSEWQMYDKTQNTNIYDALMKATKGGTKENLTKLELSRNVVTDPMREVALKKAATFDISTPMQTAAKEELAGPRGVIPSAKTVLNYVIKETKKAPSLEEISRKANPKKWKIYDGMNENVRLKNPNFYQNLISKVADETPDIGKTITPERLYEMRKYISDTLKKPFKIDKSEVDAAVKSAGVVSINMKNAIDDTLNKATDGEWSSYLKKYSSESKGVINANALNKIRNDLLDKASGGLSSNIVNNEVIAPQITRKFLSDTIKKHSFNKYGKTLTPESAKDLASVMKTLQMKEAPLANLKSAGTSGGSDTAMTMGLGGMANNLAMATGAINPKLYYARQAINYASNLGKKTAATDLAKILQSSEETAKFLRMAAAREKAINAGAKKTRMGGSIGASFVPDVNQDQ